ncbi:archaellin/type IV pilin N-terminal domain-containing protein [Methanosarcina sp. Mfa9]|uniref:archaellin/type IV pilin N-terminal domain-containing protein n=1 Tax=Methanosarcina sp. Mfa9 TaxID=3439063 RepID=UPI003F84C264
MKFNKLFGRFGKDEKAFTGLESAIVLTAFIVVAAVFSYVVLGAGFSTSDTAKATVDEGIKQATSSIELAGDVIGVEGSTDNTLDYLLVTIQLTAGQAPVDIGADSSDDMLVVSYWDAGLYESNVSWNKTFIGDNDGDKVLEQHEKVELNITVPDSAKLQTADDAVNREFKLEVKPKIGATLPVTRTTPFDLDAFTVIM